MKTLKIPQGNAFAAHFPIVVKEENGTEHPIDTTLLTDVHVVVMHNGITEALTFEAYSDGITVTFPDTLPVDIYSVFITGKLNGRPVASNMRDVVNIVRWNEHANFPDFIPGDTLTAPTSIFIGATPSAEMAELVASLYSSDGTTMDKLRSLYNTVLDTQSVTHSTATAQEYMLLFQSLYEELLAAGLTDKEKPSAISLGSALSNIMSDLRSPDCFGADFKMYMLSEKIKALKEIVEANIDFDDMSGTGGNDGLLIGQVATTLAGTITCSNCFVVEQDKVYAAHKCIKLGNSTKSGKLNVGIMTDNMRYLLRFRAIRWQGSKGILNVMVMDNELCMANMIIATTDEWKEYGIEFIGHQSMIGYRAIITNYTNGDRCFIDDIRLLSNR